MIGFYVHHHGTGHLARTRSVLEMLDEPAAVLTSIDVDETSLPKGTELIRLPLDHDQSIDRLDDDHAAGGALHWAPVGTGETKARSAALVDWLSRPDADLIVVDMSVEVLVQARLCGVPSVAVRSSGLRTDRAHRLGYDCASAILAPYPVELEDPTAPPELVRRTYHAGLYGRATGRSLAVEDARRATGLTTAGDVLVICVGSGGNALPPNLVRRLPSVLPGWSVRVVGIDGELPSDGDVRFVGWVDDLFPWLRAADVVVGNTSANLTAEVAAADRPFIGIAEDRPHDEQRSRAKQLEAAGAALTAHSWPALERWPSLIDGARRLGSEVLSSWSARADRTMVARWLQTQTRRFNQTCGTDAGLSSVEAV